MLIIGVLIGGDPMKDLSIFSPFLFSSNFLLIEYEGETIRILFYKGFLLSTSMKNFLDEFSVDDEQRIRTEELKIYLHQLTIDEIDEIPDGFVRLNEEKCFHWKKFLRLNRFDRILLDQLSLNEWKEIFRYARLRDQLDRLKYFLLKMKLFLRQNNEKENQIDFIQLEELFQHFHLTKISLQQFFLFDKQNEENRNVSSSNGNE